ncbi:MAG: saccharopine dehydrogenase NADP-binding domain-containing protein [Pseudomonadota bacterium]
MKEKHFDFILYGATSFVGKIICEYLANYDSEDFTWAMAGRSEKKITKVKNECSLTSIPHFIVDADNEVLLEQLARQTKVVISTVGPYALYGEPLLKVCAKTGTDYCDLTGEPQWIKRMLDTYEYTAKASGARIINAAGFDSIPSDLGVYFSQQFAYEKTGSYVDQIKMRVRKIRGGASGGTVASLLNVLKEAKSNPALKRALVNPYVLCPVGHPYTVRQKNHKKAEFESELKLWSMPFVMAAINERIVHRSNALLGNRYGSEFRYDEAMSSKKSLDAKKMAYGLGAFMFGASISPVRWLLEKIVLPKPGEGPSKKQQLKGMFDMRFFAKLDDKYQQVKVEGDRDPGYGSTAKMLVQTALALAKDVPDLPGGFWTPAAGLNEPLKKRLEKHAGVTVSLVDDG